MKSRFVVVEGVNGVGKTTIIRKALTLLDESWIYSKGFTLDSGWDRLINTHPHNFIYYLDLAYKTQVRIKPLLGQGRNVLQDRYVQSVDSFLPDAAMLHNRVYRQAINPLFLKPSLYIHLTASIDEVIARLEKSANDAYRLRLSRHPEEIRQREDQYLRIYEKLACPKQVLDTSRKTPRQCSDELVRIIQEEHA